MKVKEESEKAGLKLNIQKTNILASSPITSWERVTNFIFLGSQITVDDDCSHKIKRCLLLERKQTNKQENYDQPRQLIKKHRPYRQMSV